MRKLLVVMAYSDILLFCLSFMFKVVGGGPKKKYKSLVNPDTGELLYPDYEATFEADLWPNVVIGERRAQTPGYRFGSGLLSNMVTDNPSLDVYSMDTKNIVSQLYKKWFQGNP